jgi:hypothetical protein
VAIRIEARSVGGAISLMEPVHRIARTKMPYVSTGPRISVQLKPRLQANSNVEANQAITNVIPQMPATAATCISGMNPYCEYAIEPQLAAGVKCDRRNSAATSAIGKTSVATTPLNLGDTIRSTTNGSVTIVASSVRMAM